MKQMLYRFMCWLAWRILRLSGGGFVLVYRYHHSLGSYDVCTGKFNELDVSIIPGILESTAKRITNK